MNDPFASAPSTTAPAADEANTESVFDSPPAEVPAKKEPVVVNNNGEGKLVLTFKGGTGFDAPWIVVHASNLDEAFAYVSTDSEKFMDLMTRVQNAGQHFAGLGGSKPAKAKPAGGGGQRTSAPRGSQEPPAWFPEAPGEGYEYKTGMKKDGSGVYHAWAPPGRGGKWVFHNQN